MTEYDHLPRQLDELHRHYKRLVEFEKDQLARLKFKAGDRVSLKNSWQLDRSKAPGWTAAESMLVPGNPATIQEIHWGTYRKTWMAVVTFELDWSESWWSPARLHIYKYPPNHHHFAFALSTLRRLRKSDTPPEIPRATFAPDLQVTVHEENR